jgi:L-amino acid N-acyltransferase YncA
MTAPTERSALTIDALTEADWPAVRRIFEEGIATDIATLETEAPGWPEWDASHRDDCRFVARRRGEVVGWIALSAPPPRRVYAGVAWLSVYVTTSERNRGVGRALFHALIPASETEGLWTLQAGVIADNRASLALHERAGFRRIGVQERLGRDRHGRWRDVVLLERRSGVVGAR